MLLVLGWEDDQVGRWRPLVANDGQDVIVSEDKFARGDAGQEIFASDGATVIGCGKRTRQLIYDYIELLQRRRLFSRAIRVAHLSVSLCFCREHEWHHGLTTTGLKQSVVGV